MWNFELSSYLFENETTGLALGLYWHLAGEDSISEDRLLLDFIELPSVRRLDDLDGVTVEEEVGDGIAWASLHRDGHLPASGFSLEIRRGESRGLRASVVLHEVEDSLSSHYIGDVKAKGELRFVEFVVREKSLSRRVPDADAARALLGKFVDVGELSLISGDPYRFGPKG